jgi:menaquinone-specific isochorismate synthase
MDINTEKILNEFTAFTGTSASKGKPKLISFAFRIQPADALLLTDTLNKYFNDIFLFRTPNGRFTVIGINSALELSNDGAVKFISLYQNYNYWKKNFINNWQSLNIPELPFIFCTVKFDPLKSISLRNDFNPLRLYIPELMFSFHNGETKGYFNFVFDNKISDDELRSRFLSHLEKMCRLSSSTEKETSSKTPVPSESVETELNKWIESAKKALKELNDGSVEKLVLSRTHNFNFNTPVNWSGLLIKLYQRFPDCYLFFLKKNKSVFFGSSPEMFLKVSDSTAEVESVAGSAPRGERSETDFEFEKSLKASEKNHQEHLYVSEFISEILIKYSNNVRIIEEKQIRKLDNIQHLITRISAGLNSKENLFELIDALFPTPAVCGVPKDSAMNLIRRLEPHDRGLYSGLVGIFDFNGNCELAVSIRSALFKDNRVTAFAGAGLVKYSDIEEEFLETELKLNTILSLFADENKS